MPLKLTQRKKGGAWQITGSLCGERVRESAGTTSVHHAEAKLAKRSQEILDRATFGLKRTSTFAEAVDLHLEAKMETLKPYDALFISKLNAHFGNWRIADIQQADVVAFCTPLIAIWRRAAKANLCEMRLFERPEKPDRKPINPPDDTVIAKLIPQCSLRLAAAALLMTFTGARVSEACRLTEKAVDWARGEATLLRTKNGKTRVVPLAGVVLDAMKKLKGTKGPFFGFSGQHSLNQALTRACKRAGLDRITSHKVGRHAFAKRLLAQGYTLKEVQEAGGWLTYRMVAEIYDHLEKSAMDAAVRASDTNLTQLLDPSSNVVPIQRRNK
jgi:integrase